jgi:hypothetical protein
MDSNIASLLASELMRSRLDGATHAAAVARTRRRRNSTNSPDATTWRH